MKEEKKPKNKKKILLYYLVLAACLLVIAAVTVTVVFTVGTPKAPPIAGNDPTNPDDNNPDDNKPDDEDKPTVNETGYKLPVSGALTHEYEFVWHPSITQYRVHLGLDFAGNVGDEVCAVLDGEVTALAKTSTIGETFITVKHADGNSSTYKYIDVKDNLQVGSKVKRGEVIGTIAAAGGYEHEKGAHLHLEFTDANGKEFDPATKLYDQK